MASKSKRKVAPRVVMGTRVHSETAEIIERLALRHRETPSEHIAKVLDAYAQGLSFCQQCQRSHTLQEAVFMHLQRGG